MPRFPFQIVGFDLDGTLVDSNLDLTPALNHALVTAGRPPVPPESVRDFVGGGTAMMLTRALEHTGGAVPEGEFQAILGELLLYYEAHIADHTMPYPGCLEALDALAERGCILAIITNKIEAYARKLLEALGMISRFDIILGGDTLGPGRAKPAPDMIDTAILMSGLKDSGGRFAMVGDSSYDVRAARNAKVPVVAVSFGYSDMPAQDLCADAVIDHYDELVSVLETL